VTRRGVVYACSHTRWLGETLVSAQSCRQHMPDIRRQIFVTPALASTAGPQLAVFDDVVVVDHPDHEHRPRFDATLRTDCDEAVFIDGDTLFLAPVYELFEVLRDFDIGLTLAPQYLSPLAVKMGILDRMPAVSPALAEWNSGMIVARVDNAFRAMVRRWSALFIECLKAGFSMDQAALRVALSESRLRVATLANNYNFRALLAQDVSGVVKILHAHGELARIGATINTSTGLRLFTPKPEDIHGFHPKQ
jgi:hypothetical protein